MKIQIYAIASRSTDSFEENFSMYQKRLPAHINLKLTTIPLAYRSKNSPIEEAVEKESELLLKRINTKDTLIVMDENGKTLSTEDFSNWMHQWMLNSINPILAIGGPDGFSNAVHQRANKDLSLSKMTLPHALIPIILAEQIYRAWTILDGQPYHRS
jgi:23S rRNA (pseudouridine1915-N3)-methyltransferase